MQSVTVTPTRRAMTLGLLGAVGTVAFPGLTSSARAAATDLPTAAAAYMRTRPGSAGVSAVDLTTGRSVSYRSTSTYVTASIVKTEILIALLLAAQAKGRDLTATEQSLTRSMITRSDNGAATSVFNEVGGASALTRTGQALALTDTVANVRWGLTRTTPRDQIKVLRAVFTTDSPLASAGRQYAADLMGAVVSGQRWGVSAIGTKNLALKNGWLPYSADDYRWTINSTGRVTLANGHPALVAVLSKRSPSMTTGVNTVQQLARLAAAALTG